MIMTLLLIYALTLGATFWGIVDPILSTVSALLGSVLIIRARWAATWADSAIIPALLALSITTASSAYIRRSAVTWAVWTIAALVWWGIAAALRSGRADRRGLIRAVLIAACIHAAAAIVQAVQGAPRAWGLTGNPNILGGFMALALPLALSEWNRSLESISSGVRRWIPGIGVILLLIALLASGSAGGALAGIAAAACWLALERGPDFRAWRSPILVGLGTAGVLAGVAGVIKRYSFKRLDLWQQAAHIFARFPLLGSGPNTFGALLDGNGLHGALHHSHNMIANIAAEGGMIGLAAALLLGIALGRRLWKMRGDGVTNAGIAAGVGVIVHGFVDFTLSAPVMVLGVVIIMAAGTIKETTSLRMVYLPFSSGADDQKNKVLLYGKLAGVLAAVVLLIVGSFQMAYVAYTVGDTVQARALDPLLPHYRPDECLDPVPFELVAVHYYRAARIPGGKCE
jgi:O-antigen ligase